MSARTCVALILAGGRGEQLGALTRSSPKPVVHFGRKYRIIDYTLNNCKNSGIGTIGILSQNFSDELHSYISYHNDYYSKDNNIHMLPPKNNDFYNDMVDAVYKNIDFVNNLHPEYVLVLSGDHVYKMDYGEIIAYHKCTGADITAASTRVPTNEASKYGVVNADRFGRVFHFEDKPFNPKGNLALMGVYVFKWQALKSYLLDEITRNRAQNDFGKDMIPFMLYSGRSIYTYIFSEYWRDIETLDGLWEANLDQINYPFSFNFPRYENETMQEGAVNISHAPKGMAIKQSLVSDCTYIYGKVENSVLGEQVMVGSGSEVVDSYIMPGAYIGNNAKIYKTIIGAGAVINDSAVIGGENGTDFLTDRILCKSGVSLVAPHLHVAGGMNFKAGSHIDTEGIKEMSARVNLD